MNAVVQNFQFNVVGSTRDETLSRMDRMSFELMEQIGGAPWITVDDDIKKVRNPGITICDDQGFIYIGVRTVHFGGPYVSHGNMQLHDGFQLQKALDQ